MFVLRSETEGNGWTIGSLHNVRRLATGQVYSMLGGSSARPSTRVQPRLVTAP